MKYLKLFEHQDYYKKITRDEFFKMTDDDKLSEFDDYEISTVCDIFSNSEYRIINNTTMILTNIGIDKMNSINITKAIDEYYLVFVALSDEERLRRNKLNKAFTITENNPIRYRCDQFGGLLKFLNDFKEKLK